MKNSKILILIVAIATFGLLVVAVKMQRDQESVC